MEEAIGRSRNRRFVKRNRILKRKYLFKKVVNTIGKAFEIVGGILLMFFSCMLDSTGKVLNYIFAAMLISVVMILIGLAMNQYEGSPMVCRYEHLQKRISIQSKQRKTA